MDNFQSANPRGPFNSVDVNWQPRNSDSLIYVDKVSYLHASPCVTCGNNLTSVKFGYRVATNGLTAKFSRVMSSRTFPSTHELDGEQRDWTGMENGFLLQYVFPNCLASDGFPCTHINGLNPCKHRTYNCYFDQTSHTSVS